MAGALHPSKAALSLGLLLLLSVAVVPDIIHVSNAGSRKPMLLGRATSPPTVPPPPAKKPITRPPPRRPAPTRLRKILCDRSIAALQKTTGCIVNPLKPRICRKNIRGREATFIKYFRKCDSLTCVCEGCVQPTTTIIKQGPKYVVAYKSCGFK